MPKGQPRLSASDVAAIRQWVEAGESWPAEIKLEDRSKSGPWWSLAPLVRPAVPDVSSDLIRTPIDAFILAKHNELGLRHTPEADRRTLIRRLSFDLHRPAADAGGDRRLPGDDAARCVRETGRPPAGLVRATASAGAGTGSTSSTTATRTATTRTSRDQRLALPRLRHRALNADKPYSRFVQEQLAGDVLFPDDPDGIDRHRLRRRRPVGLRRPRRAARGNDRQGDRAARTIATTWSSPPCPRSPA